MALQQSCVPVTSEKGRALAGTDAAVRLIDPLTFFSARFDHVNIVQEAVDGWGAVRRGQRRRTSSHMRYKRALRKLELSDKPCAAHRWLAKRMKMETQLGLKLPMRSASLGLDATLDICTNHCALHDASYWQWGECSAPSLDILAEALNRLVDQEVSLELGQRHGPVMAHVIDAFPNKAIAPIYFIFSHPEPSLFCLRVGVHAAAFDALDLNLNESLRGTGASLKRVELFTFMLIGPKSESVLAELIKALEDTNQDSLAAKVPETEPSATRAFFDASKSLDDVVENCFRQAEPSRPVEFTSIARPGTRRKLLGQGYDVMMHSRTVAQRVWYRLIRAGAVCIGVDDLEHLQVAMRRPSFPRDFPDTTLCTQYWRAQAAKASERWLSRPPNKRQEQLRPRQPSWEKVCGTHELVVARGWANVSAFVANPNDMDGVPTPGLLLRCVFSAPRTRQARFTPACPIYAASDEDYAAFIKDHKVDRFKSRPESAAPLGYITSADVASAHRAGVGLVSATGWLKLMEQAKSRRFRRRRLMVLFQSKGQWGVAYASVASDV